jgi:hypothetical protein
MSLSFIKKALVVTDIDDGHTHVELEYIRYVGEYEESDKGYKRFIDYFLTEPIGDWQKLSFKKSTIPYEQFLSTMVKQTLEVKRRLANIALENIIKDDPSFHTKVRVLHTSKIIEPTFVPPFIDSESSWQVSLLNSLCEEHLPDLIERADSSKRLIKMFKVLKDIQGL